MRRGIGRLRAGGGGVATDSDAALWAAAVTTAGGTYSASTLAAVSAFCVSAKANGYWTKLNRINLMCGNQLTAARVPLKTGGGGTVDTNISFVSGDYTEATGITGNGTTKYLRTGLIPSATLTLNDTHLAVYNRAASATGAGAALGAVGAAANIALSFYGPFTDGRSYSDEYDGAAELVSAVLTAPYRLMIGSRTASNAHSIYQAGTSVASEAVVSGSLPGTEEYVFSRNSNGSPVQFSAHAFGGYSIGSGLSAADVTAYSADMQTFQTALGRNV